MSEGLLLDVFLNPLLFIEGDEHLPSKVKASLTPEAVLNFACAPGKGSDLDNLVARYREISKQKEQLFAAPTEDRILQKLVFPLCHAKASYMFGNCLGTISLCGMVAEMVAMLLFDISAFKINNNLMNPSDQKAVFGSCFEKLGQQRRVDILDAYMIIDAETKTKFDLIRERRKRYLHLWSQDHETLANDAVAVYQAAVSIVVGAIGQDIRDGKICLNPRLVKYLERRGSLEPKEDSDEP